MSSKMMALMETFSLGGNKETIKEIGTCSENLVNITDMIKSLL